MSAEQPAGRRDTICIIATGSRGDVQPLVALGAGLVAAGHDVTISSADDFRDLVEAHGVAFSPSGVSMSEVLAAESSKKWLGHTSHNPVAEVRAMRAMMADYAPIQAAQTLRLTGSADLFISGVASAHCVAPVAQVSGARHVVAQLAPYTPTRLGTSSLFGRPWPGARAANRLAGSLSLAALAWAFGEPGRLVRRELGLPDGGIREFVNLMVHTPTVLGASPRVVPPATDWPASHRVAGYWTLDAPSWHASSDLTAFLEEGPPPVYVGFGSMSARDGARLPELLAQAAERAGVRVLTHRGAAMAEVDVASSGAVHVIDDVPHGWLFPRMAAVIHHGGAGTTAAALHAGVPSMAVPHIGDQPYWGRRLAALGVGPRPIARHRLTAERLAAAMQLLVGTPAYVARAQALAAALAGEDGVGSGVRAITELAGRA